MAHYGTGFDDKLQPTHPLDLSQVKPSPTWSRPTAAPPSARARWARPPTSSCTWRAIPTASWSATVSGAMTVAKMGLVLCDMIDHGMVQAVIATGALMAHGFVEASGKLHFKYDPTMSDDELFEKGYNRVFDSIELERNLDDVEHIFRAVLEVGRRRAHLVSSHRITHALGKHLSENDLGRGILRSAYEKRVPVYVPAFSDSELGLDFAIHTHRRRKPRRSRRCTSIHSCDVDDYSERVRQGAHARRSSRSAAACRATGRSRVGPYLDLLQKRAGIGAGLKRFQVRRAHLSRADALGRALGMHVLRRRVVGQVRADRARAAATPRSTRTRRSPGHSS